MAQQANTQTFQIAVPVADLRATPGGGRVRQLLQGESVKAHGQRDGAFMVEAAQDGYRGFVDPAALGAPVEMTHKVSVLGTHLYAAPDIKAQDLVTLSFGARLSLTEQAGDFWRTRSGRFVPACHVVKAHMKFRDPVAVAELFLGTPYLWGGNSRLGIDCSGLVQAACRACGIACPGDTQDQVSQLGTPVAARTPPQRGDLLFWRGHVALMTSRDEIIHANAHYMSVVCEPLDEALARISSLGGGEITAHRRL